jgi:hypothetical protein
MTAEKNSERNAATTFVRKVSLGMLTIAVLPALAFPQTVPAKSPPTNPDSMVISNYEKRVDEYVKLRKKAAAGIPAGKTTDSPEQLKDSQLVLASRIRAERSQAKQGDIFTPDTCQLFKKLIAQAYRESDPAKVKATLRHAEPVRGIPVSVNASYPEKVPLQTTPPSILANLPPLPKDLEYRVVGQDLVLRDAEANIVADVIPGAIPGS